MLKHKLTFKTNEYEFCCIYYFEANLIKFDFSFSWKYDNVCPFGWKPDLWMNLYHYLRKNILFCIYSVQCTLCMNKIKAWWALDLLAGNLGKLWGWIACEGCLWHLRVLHWELHTNLRLCSTWKKEKQIYVYDNIAQKLEIAHAVMLHICTVHVH